MSKQRSRTRAQKPKTPAQATITPEPNAPAPVRFGDLIAELEAREQTRASKVRIKPRKGGSR